MRNIFFNLILLYFGLLWVNVAQGRIWRPTPMEESRSCQKSYGEVSRHYQRPISVFVAKGHKLVRSFVSPKLIKIP